jgi:hypothetical protein
MGKLRFFRATAMVTDFVAMSFKVAVSKGKIDFQRFHIFG